MSDLSTSHPGGPTSGPVSVPVPSGGPPPQSWYQRWQAILALLAALGAMGAGVGGALLGVGDQRWELREAAARARAAQDVRDQAQDRAAVQVDQQVREREAALERAATQQRGQIDARLERLDERTTLILEELRAQRPRRGGGR